MAIIGKNDEWETPRYLLDQAMMQYGIRPRLDVAATKDNTRCNTYLSKEEDALKHEWTVDFFMNPPYSKIKEFMKHASLQSRLNHINGLCLSFAKTDTQWWHDYVEGKAEVHFIKGRVKFEMNGEVKNTAPYPSCWIIFRGGNT